LEGGIEMRVNVKYTVPSFVMRYLRVFGQGRIHVRDVALVLEGEYPKFYIPTGLLNSIFQRLICVTSYRTIPYSRIVRYSPPKIFRKHTILFENPAGVRTWVAFRLQRKEKKLKLLLISRIQENLVAARALLPH
jgi:hypothetical protein